MLEYVHRTIVAALIAAALILSPLSGVAPTPAHAGLLTRAVAAGTTYISANLIRVMRGGSGKLHSGAEWNFCLTAARMAADQER
jgi:branched-subunit amino acid transport protein